MTTSPVGRMAARLLLLMAAVGSLHTGTEAARCGPQPTTVFVQKGEKRMVSYWHRPEPEDAQLGSGEGPDPTAAEQDQPLEGEEELEKAAGEAAPQPTAAGEITTPLIVTAGPPQEGTPTPLYDQQPHIILPEAPPPPPPSADGGTAGALAADSATELSWEVPQTAGTEADATDVEQLKQSDSDAVSADEPEPQTSVDAGESNDSIPSQQIPVFDNTAADDSVVEDDKAEGSGSILFDGDDLLAVPSSDADSPVQTSETFSFTIEGSGEPVADSVTSSNKDSSTIFFNANDALTLEAEAVAFSFEGSGDIAMDPADAVEGSGAEPVAVPVPVSSEGAAAGSVSTLTAPSQDVITAAVVSSPQATLSAVVDRIQSLTVSSPAESDGLESDELLPLEETNSGYITGDIAGDVAEDLAVSASEPVAVVVAAPAVTLSEAETEVEKERLLVVKELQEDRVILEDVPDAEESGSGAGPELESEEPTVTAGIVVAPADDATLDGSGMSENMGQEENRQEMESEIIKAVVDVMSIMTDIHGLVGKEEAVKPVEGNAEEAIYRPSYRVVDADTKQNQVAVPVRPGWGGYQGYGAPSRLPSGSPRPLRPYLQPGPQPRRPGPVWERLRHRPATYESGRPGPGHVYFPGQFRRGGRPDDRRAPFRPPGGSRFAARLGAPRPPLPGYLRRGPSPAGYGRPFNFNAKRSIKSQDEHLLRFLQSQPHPFVSALTGDRPAQRGARQSRAAPVDCQWQIETEPHLYLLVTLHNLSAPLTVDCSGAYIEVERENDGFEARWCGDRVRKEGTRPHLVFARGEVRIAVHSGQQAGLPTGFDAEVEVIDLLDGGQYVKFRRSGLNFRRLIQEPLLPAT